MQYTDAHERGSASVSIRKFVRKRFGAQGEAELLSQVSPEVADTYLNSIPHKWYPGSHTRALLDAIFEMAGRDENVITDIGAAQAADDVKGILRFLVLFATPHQLVRQAAKVWSQHVDAGEMNYEKLSSQGCEIVLRDFNNGPLDCLMTTGTMKALAELTGAREVEVEHAECIHRDGKVCRWKVSWA